MTNLFPCLLLWVVWSSCCGNAFAFSPLKSRHVVDTSRFLSPTSQKQDKSTEFPPPLSRVDRLKRAGQFWATAVPVIASYYSTMLELQFRQEVLGEIMTADQLERTWDQQHVRGAQTLSATIESLKGFYVKTAQIIASRQDLFPKQYTDALGGFTDNIDPMPVTLVKAVIEQELLRGGGEQFHEVFSEFDDIPLGAASVAQVHRAVLTPKYGGPKEVAVKVQRPSIESKLMGDISNLKTISKALQDALPLDYYTVFCELEKQLADEFDFVAEAAAMDRIYTSVTISPNGSARKAPLVIPRPVPGLVCRRVLVMDYLHGVPLSRARDEMIKKGIDPAGPEAKLFGRRLLSALTAVFGRTILETGFFHADPHPGNIFVLEDGQVGLIDFGQVKQISGRNRETLAKVMIALDERIGDGNPEDLTKIGNLALELGVEINDDAKDEAAAAVAMWLFDGSVQNLPGGYDKGELSPNSPVKELKSFPQDLVLVGRATILIKGLSSRLDIPWSLSREWAPIAREVLLRNQGDATERTNRVRFRNVLSVTKEWASGKATALVQRLPTFIKKRVVVTVVKIQDAKTRQALHRRTKEQ